MRIYVASKTWHAPTWRALRAAGFPITASWIDWKFNTPGAPEPGPADWAEHWERRCISEAASCDLLIFLALEHEIQCGALIELGAALASGARVFVVSPYDWTISHHPRCRVFADLDAALAALRYLSR